MSRPLFICAFACALCSACVNASAAKFCVGNGELSPIGNPSSGQGAITVNVDEDSTEAYASTSVHGLSVPTTGAYIEGRDTQDNPMKALDFTKFSTPVYAYGFKLSQDGVLDPVFVHNQGGTPAKAAKVFIQQLKAGKGFIRVTTSNYQSGEIGGALAVTEEPCDEPTAHVQFTSTKVPLQPPIKSRLVGDNEVNCSAKSERCLINVYARVGADRICRLYIDSATILVPKPILSNNRRIRVIWQITPQDVDDPHDYRFRYDDGISFKDSKNANDVLMDFADPDEETKDRRRYKWTSINLRTLDSQKLYFLHYVPNVQWHSAKSDRWLDCLGGDPTISNTN